MKVLSSVSLLLLICACSNSDSSKNNIEARELFQKSTELINQYSDKIGLASTPYAVDSLLEHFDKDISDLNFAFPPQTDLSLTEQENDSLIKLLDRMQFIKKNRLQDFYNETDSMINDLPKKDSNAVL